MKPSLTLFLAASFVICSCTSTKPKPNEEAKKPVVEGPKLVGRIASIPADKRFVLIQSYGKWEVESGRILTTRGPDDRTANLRTTGESLGEFAAADLQSGAVEVGDAVYSQHVVKPTPLLTTPEVPQSQGETLPENVQKNN
ncbi:MAG: hypothetical protein V4819_13005 [Verrucomicrobiota bacterium]